MISQAQIVLVIENDHLVCQYVAELLEDHGFVPFTATSAEEAVKLFCVTAEIDILITDIDLGSGITGFDLAKLCTKVYGEVPIIYVTGSNAPSSKVVQRSKYMVKPYEDITLLTNIKEMLALRAQ